MSYFQHQDTGSTSSNLLAPSNLSAANRSGSLDLSRTHSDPFRDPSFDYSSSARPSFDVNHSPQEDERPRLPSRPSEVVRQLASAIEDDELPTPREATPEPGPRPSHKKTASTGSGGLLQQFRSGSGWFAPVVPPEKKLSREEREEKEKERIKKLKDGKGKPRPSLLKRMSSGVELPAWGFGSTSPSKGGAKGEMIVED